MHSLADIRGALQNHCPLLASPAGKFAAAVSLVLQDTATGLQLLFMERTRHGEDPWSGHIAFPGGRAEDRDPDLKHTAEREALEEVGLDLSYAAHLGRLDDVTGSSLPVIVSGFVYGIAHEPVLELNQEVREAFWFPLSGLIDPSRQVQASFTFGGGENVRPAVDLLGPGRPLLWGITYRFTCQLLMLLGHGLPPAAPGPE